MAKIDEVETAIAQAAYPDVHPDFTDACWRRMARAAIEAMGNYPVDTTSTIGSAMPDRAAQPDSSATEEIEVTPEMIQAGLEVLYQSGSIENPLEGADRSLVERIFLAMHQYLK